MKIVSTLPENYKERYCFSQKKSGIQTIAWMLFCAVLIAGLVLLVYFFDPLKESADIYFSGSFNTVIYMVAVFASVLLYRILKAVIRMVLLKVLGAKSVKFSFVGTYACSGSNDYFDIMSYIVLAVAPIVILGAVLIVINILIPIEWFFLAFLVLYINFTMIFSEILVLLKVFSVSGNALVSAPGNTLTVYA